MPEIDSILQWFALIGYAVLLGTLFFLLALVRGRQTVANLILATLFAWPLWQAAQAGLTHANVAVSQWGAVALFIGCAGGTTWLTYRIMPAEFSEKTLESFGKKLLLAAGATVLILLVTFHLLGLGTVIPGGGGVAPFFSPDHYTVWWILLVYASLYSAL
jgi:hypothetical protein